MALRMCGLPDPESQLMALAANSSKLMRGRQAAKSLGLSSWVLLLLVLPGCYTVNQEGFTKHVEQIVAPGMRLSEAAMRLSKDGFACDALVSSPAVTCTRDRQSVLPYTCIERVNLVSSNEIVSAIQVPPIACAGF